MVRYAIPRKLNTRRSGDKVGVWHSIGIAAEAVVGLALIIAIYRHYKTTNVDQIDSMKG